MFKPNIDFILSVDTEEEWDWSGEFPTQDFSVSNIHEIPAFQNFCQEHGLKPTYFVDYPVAENTISAEILAQINPENCEIGAHLHPWANPPFYQHVCEKSSHVINLPIDQVKQKLSQLIELIKQNIGHTPTTFRTGRWGINGDILKLLENKDFTIDSSIYPLYKNKWFSCETAPLSPYWPDYNNTNVLGAQRKILEIPVTCGFNRSNYQLAQQLHSTFTKQPFKSLKINGLLWHSNLLKKLYLSPELCTSKDMIQLVEQSLKKGHTVLHMYLHSSSLVENITGLSSESDAREKICRRIQEVVEFTKLKANVNFTTISEARHNFLKGSASNH